MTRIATKHCDLEVPDRFACYPGEIELDDEFRDLLPQPPLDQDAALIESLRRDGWTVPLVVWKRDGRLVLLIGYSSYAIVQKAGQRCRVVVKEFADRSAARRFIIHYARANHMLTALALRYYRGLRYDDTKPPRGGTPKASEGKDHDRGPEGRMSLGMSLSAAALAELYHVDERTIERDAELSRAIETLAARGGAGTRRLLLAEKARATCRRNGGRRGGYSPHRKSTLS